ncbi:unnamed protein product [Allacma fusca]|uniref:Uncharacterized protein n=1 Tax=Allacma fusca TaxID=39272 RepID=A0A8J2K3Y2_9HEXA|nr:unnamed protein product [Allacma fusca]
MSASKSDKPPRIKGLVKRCRSFKEDILSRLARNRSLGQDGHGHSPGVASPTGWNSDGDALLPGDIPGVEPHVSICHRLKEAHLTLQFVESLIQKNCIDLLGGSSNVMLDLMGCLLNDVKKASASDR